MGFDNDTASHGNNDINTGAPSIDLSSIPIVDSSKLVPINVFGEPEEPPKDDTGNKVDGGKLAQLSLNEKGKDDADDDLCACNIT